MRAKITIFATILWRQQKMYHEGDLARSSVLIAAIWVAQVISLAMLLIAVV